MAQQSFKYYSILSREFRAISPNDHRAKVHFFEKHEDQIRGFYSEEVFDFITAYAESLFETNDFRRFLVVVEEVLLRSIQLDLPLDSGQDIYRGMLFRKAKAHLKLREFEPCNHTLTELLRMSPTNPAFVQLLGKSWYHQKPEWVKHVRAFTVVLFILTALITSLEVLFVTPFTPEWTDDIQLIRNITFSIATFILVGSEGLHRWQIHQKMKAYQEEAQIRKRRKKRAQPK